MPAKSIKTLKPRMGKSSRYKQGYYDISKSTKYTTPNEPCIYRSSYEYKFIKWCEYSDIVKRWSSEAISVKYLCMETGVQRTYWLDFSIITNKDETWIIEVKPHKEVHDVEHFGQIYSQLTSAIEQKRYVMSNKRSAKNWSKWTHAKKIAEQQGAKFIIVTERFLQKYK